MSNLLNYLNALDKDAVIREAHAKDPKATMTKFGLSADEQAVLMSGDKKKVAALVGIHEDSLPSIQVNISSF